MVAVITLMIQVTGLSTIIVLKAVKVALCWQLLENFTGFCYTAYLIDIADKTID